MAASAWTVYTAAANELGTASFNLSSATYVVILATNSYTPAPNTDSTYANVSTYELTTSGGYTVGGVALTSQSWTTSTATVTFTSANPSWSTFTAGPFRYAVIIHRAGGSLVSGDLLLCYSDLTGGGTITGGGGTFTISMNASGIFTLTHSP